jgi:hypothetical protein
VFGVLTAVWAGWRFRAGLRTTGITALGATAALAWSTPGRSAAVPALLLLWVLDDIADWYCDRWSSRTSASTALRGADAARAVDLAHGHRLPRRERAAARPRLRLRHAQPGLRGAARRPLSRFDHVPAVVAVSHDILELRGKAMPRFPQQPL